MPEPMSDERLAEARHNHAAYKASHAHAESFACCSAHASADDVPELVTEVERLRSEHDTDTEAVRGALVALDVLRVALPGPAARRVAKLHARFADRIAVLNARAEEGR